MAQLIDVRSLIERFRRISNGAHVSFKFQIFRVFWPAFAPEDVLYWTFKKLTILELG